jgi:hypothetical protein
MALSRGLVLAAVLGAGMGLGGVHWVALLPCAALAIAAGIVSAEGISKRAVGYVPVLVLLALAAYTAFQALPLPIGWVRALSPDIAEIWAGAMTPFGEPAPRSATLSADPGATLVEALRWALYAGILAASTAAGARRGIEWGATALFGCACLVGATTLLHGMLGLEQVYGLYTPTFSPSRWRVGPLLNSNNLAGYLNLGMLSGLGLLVSRRPPVHRMAIGFGVATLLPLVAMSGSRAGFVALLCGLVVFTMVFVRAPGRAGSWRVLAPAGVVVAGAAVFAWLGSTGDTVHLLLDRNVEKLEVLPFVLRLVREHPWLGIGRGAFESVFPSVHVGPANVFYSHAENFPLDWAAGWGIPVAGVVLLSLAWVLLVTYRRMDGSASAAGVWAGVVALLLQNLLDLGLEVPGVMAAAVLGLGALWGHAHRHALRNRVEGAVPPRRIGWWQGGAGVAGSALAVLAALFGRHGVSEDRAGVKAVMASVDYRDAASVSRVREALHAGMHRHPADPYFPRIGGYVAWRARDRNPMPWIERALDRGMTIGQTHFELAGILASVGARRQALFELRLASGYEPGLFYESARIVASSARDFDEISIAIPDGALGARMYEAVASMLPAGAAPTKALCLQAALERDPGSVPVRSAIIEALIAALSSADPDGPCAGPRLADCMKEFDGHLAVITGRAPEDPTAILLRARLLVATGRAPDAERLLRDGCPRYKSAALASCLRGRVDAAVAARTLELFRPAAKDLDAAACPFGGSCPEVLGHLGAQAEGLGDLGDALSYFQRAAAEAGSDANWTAVARVATALGEHALAANVLANLARSHPDDPELHRRFTEETRRSMLRALER